MTRLTATLLLATFAFASVIPNISAGIVIGETLPCTHYTQANTESATCGDRPNVVCSQKCTGGVVVDGCSSVQLPLVPLTRQTCTISFTQTSTSNSSCVNGQGSFTCSGVPTGQATCSGCLDSQLQTAMLQPAPAVGPLGGTVPTAGAVGGTVATVAPAVVASSTPAAPIVPQNLTSQANVLPPKSTVPTAQVVAAIPAVAQSNKAPVANPQEDSQAGDSHNTTTSIVYVAANQEEPMVEDDNSTSTATSIYLKNSVQLVVTLGVMAVGVVTL
ncbi:hypothetical protein PGT21_014734 [Puccinia graminis f. sp. tritici]|uniref:Secreted protein n=1 Tax=Puccinia graminis f. sp. tritici TaxID=56615 RepID=A0A5B0PG91_PUCGR|nr:hypothetical protein PGTUg99_018290 [Puccinia graminis f. sp. tritici]KAA1105662.1 hypothetical protein PGT21_014734 [Puccinia graminis f. sp. tritici]